LFKVIILLSMKSNLTQEDAIEIYNSGPEFVIKTFMEHHDEIETLKSLLQADIKRIEIEKILSELNLDVENLSLLDEEVANAIRKLLQIIESLNDENTKLRNEIEYLKGKKKRSASADEKSDEKKDRSSEKERKLSDQPAKEPKSKAKKHKIRIDRTEYCKVDKSQLPEDAEFKGYTKIVVQEIKITTDNVEYKREVYYSKSEGKTYIAEFPSDMKGEFGPGIKSLALILKNECNMSEPKICDFFGNFGCQISQSTISRIMTKGDPIEAFHQEKAEIVKAGLESTRCQQIDGTGALVKGQNHHVQILCNPYYTAYFTLAHKDRLSLIDIFLCGRPRLYIFNEEAFDLMESFNISESLISKLKENDNRILDHSRMQSLLEGLLNGKMDQRYLRIMESALIAFYHDQTEVPVVQVLLSDDAPEYKRIVPKHALCWVHDGRKYKALQPVIPVHQEELEKFSGRYWDYYKKLLDYKSHPSPVLADKLSLEFDELFSTETNYPALNKRIEVTKSKKAEFLRVLQYPEIEVHNNAAELAARVQARKRDVSLHTITEEGTKAQDTLLTITETARKLGVSAYEYIYDRVSRTNVLPSLASLIPAMTPA